MDGLSSICAGIGTLEEDENGNRIGYAKGEFCSDNLNDLLRFLRRDDPEKRDVFKQVCKWNIVGKDLIPIIEYRQEERNLVLNAASRISMGIEVCYHLQSSCSDYRVSNGKSTRKSGEVKFDSDTIDETDLLKKH